MSTLSQALREREKEFLAIRIFLFLNEGDTMNLEQLKAKPTQELIDLYNDLTNQQVKRMKNRQETEKRTIQALKDAGKWEEAAAMEEATGNGQPEEGPPETKGKGKAKKAVPAAKAEKPTGKAKKAPAEAKEPKQKPEKAKKEPKEKGERKKRGAPTKNVSYVLTAPNSKDRNPKGLKVQPNSSRAVVLSYLEKAKTPQTRDSVEAHFAGTDGVNAGSALYFLAKHNFIKAQ